MENKIKTPTKGESRIIKFMILLGIFSILNFLFYFFQPEHIGNSFLFILLTVTILYGVLKKLYMWYNYSNISTPEKPKNHTDFKVDILTTYYPGEPYQMVITTLKAINKITYPHTTYLCDEADDPYLKKFCQENGIRHITRDSRKDAKAGNINNALEKAATGDICVVLDPDHIPNPNFLDPILPHFKDPQIGFVQIVQSYYNAKESLVARGAAEQTFQFYGPMMMTLNSYGTVNAIGANCVFRRAALDSIGGHAPGLCEDMHTALLLYSKGWKAVYVPEVLARGLAPSSLADFFKQQLKWSRGTFDLLVKVYPKVFNKLTGRQKIHFGILPFHYLAGLITLINFLIPVLSLLLATTPWEGNVIDFALVLLPVGVSSLLIRTYIQKWVIETKERGFHIVGGLLHINTWWIYLLGLIYTIMDKEVPYLPTPKNNEWNTNLKIIIPNAVVAFISIFAIVYGLNQDLTPFSIIMAGFAFFNACIMFFGIYMAFPVTNKNRILRSYLHKKSLSQLWHLKQRYSRINHFAFETTRRAALPLLLLLLISSMNFKNQNDLSRWEQVEAPYIDRKTDEYLGIFHPSGESGLSDIQEIGQIEKKQDLNFDIISFYLAWNEKSVEEFPDSLMTATYQKNAIPMITWEPWVSELTKTDSIKAITKDKHTFELITEGFYDNYIREFANILKSYNKPVFLRFAHEFDNPQYPWYTDSKPEEFKAAWRHVHDLVKAQDAHQVIMVWNPWKAENMEEFFPGDDFVDWIGVTLLNYGPFNKNGNYYTFEELYRPFSTSFNSFTTRPVMLAEFGSVKTGNRQDEWLNTAFHSLKTKFNEVKAVVMFNSSFDKNIPENEWYREPYLNWTTKSNPIRGSFEEDPVEPGFSFTPPKDKTFVTNPITDHNIRGVRYKKGQNWRNNYYTLTKEVLTQDFKLLKETGINTIQFTGGNIYDYNILSHCKEFDLDVIYQFRITNSVGFIENEEELDLIQEKIISKVESQKYNTNIIGYSFAFDLDRYFEKPLLFYQRTAYVKWLNSLITEIKSIDPLKSIVLDIELNSETHYQMEKIRNKLAIDSYGLIVNDTTGLDDVIQYSEKENISVYLSSLDPGLLTEEMANSNTDVVLQSWQDERKSNWITFNGLLDFEGRKKPDLGKVSNFWTDSYKQIDITPASILKPAKLISPGKTFEYKAVLFNENEWILASETDFLMEWTLIKKDEFGNPLALKNLGTGADIMIEIPKDYKQYELMLIAKSNESDFITTSRSSLHTPTEH